MKKLILAGSFSALIVPTTLATVIINDDFDDGTVTGWQSLGNPLGATHNLTESGSSLTSEVIASQTNLNTHRGIVSDASFNPAAEAGGFTMTFVVNSQGVPAPGANGMFLGLTNSDSVFFRTAPTSSFGLSFFGHSARTQSNGGVSLVTNDVGSAGSAGAGLILDANPTSIQLASMQDGFTAVIGANPVGWSFSLTGTNDTGGAPTTISNSGTWADAGSDYATVFAGASWHALASNQGDPSNNTHTLVLDQISVTTVPEPSSALLGLLGLAFMARRRSR
ncbi:MAG: PEP-CTERM sorting domain-containing protein [Pirellulaceae bacterium]|nr:PEP-CTERM sorting domain-containing protein [Pirellulaceae bacterium]